MYIIKNINKKENFFSVVKFAFEGGYILLYFANSSSLMFC